MSVRQLAQSLNILLFDATPLLHIGEHRGMMRVYRGPHTCSQSAICEFSWFTCFMRPLRTSTACAGERDCYTWGESTWATGGRAWWQLTSTAGYSLRWSSMATVGMGAQSQAVNSMNAPKNTASVSSWRVVRAPSSVRNEVGARGLVEG